MVSWFSLVLCVLIATVHVNGEQPTTEGFISIDCGVKEGYTDKITNITYTTDDNFIQTGINHNVSKSYITYLEPKQTRTVRSFPEGDQNCYNLKPVIKDNKYLIRALFMYGDYDRHYSIPSDGPIVFDLNIGVNFWKTVNVTDAGMITMHEAIVVALANSTSVCLIKSGNSTPFISSLELRPLKTKLYPLANASQFLVSSSRFDFGKEELILKFPAIRYPDDPYDRIWKPVGFHLFWHSIWTDSTVTTNASDPFEAPSAVLQTATTISPNKLAFTWDAEATNVDYYAILYFSEIEELPADDVREFNIFVDDELWYGKYSPRYLVADAIYRTSPLTRAATHLFVMNNTRNATFPPLINAIEFFYPVRIKEVTTELKNVDAMLAIKGEYQVKKNWMGDPCSPRDYAWDGLSCNYGASPLRIVALNLSSNGLVGPISTSFSMLTAIKSLDLSYNNLTGPIPNFLANMQSLRVLNLTGNHFTGAIPDALLKKSLSGSLVLRY